MKNVHKNMLTLVWIWTVIRAASVVKLITLFSAEKAFMLVPCVYVTEAR